MFQLANFHIPFVKRRWYFVAFSAITVLLSLYFIATKGLNFGTDFKGGTKLQYQFSAPVSEGDVRRILETAHVEGFSVQKVGKPEENRLMVKIEKVDENEAFVQKITDDLKAGLGKDTTLEKNETVGPKAGADLRKKAQLALVVSWLLMLVYIGYRFDFAFAPGAIIALAHDVILAVGGFALTGREVSLTVVAALLTIVGYSINDTIVVYDRVRENLAKGLTKMSFRDIVNLSLNETLSRTIITSLTVFIVVVLMYFFGEGEFQNFGFAMMIGVITGVYSTFSVACPVYIALHEQWPSLQKASQKSAA
ncbi:MAG TPA: protein translocase subunit SecF [bacterium]|nr:protein translocase subunit SecF [bacterium]